MENVSSKASDSEIDADHAPLCSPAIILVEPQLGENIGQAARAMANFGLTDLRLVSPRDGWPNEKAIANAAGADAIVENATVFSTAEAAIADLNYVGATTARVRDMIKPVLTPESSVREFAARTAGGQRCGVLFGRESSGLQNEEIVLADTIIMAPVVPDFASLNLAQTVLLVGYEWRKLTAGDNLGRATEFDGPAREGLWLNKCKPATRGELLHFFAHIEAELSEAGFFKTDEKRSTMVRNIRNLFVRASLTGQEVKTLRGILVALTRVKRLRHRVE